MKTKIIAGFLLVSVLLAALCACGTDHVTKTQLDAPKIVCANGLVSWNSIANASSYNILADGKKIANTTDTFYTLSLKNGTYQITVVAVGENMYMDSVQSNAVTYTNGNSEAKIINYEVLAANATNYEGDIDGDIAFVSNSMLKQEYWWRAFEKIFTDYQDNDGGYRAEFWGKTLRGAVETYMYRADEELYAVMDRTVRNMLDIQAAETDGRLSGFDVEHEFTGWDLRSRYYIFIGFEYFYEICKDGDLKERIVTSLCQQADYVIKHIGDGEGKKGILTTSPDWGGCTSANILDGIVRLYAITGEARYKEFAEYIIGTGGSTMLSKDGKTLVQSALAADPMYTYGCRKLYEVNVFMEGILDMYVVTGDEYYLRIAMGFYQSNAGIETTEIGSLAVDVEEACHSTVEQCNPDNLGRMNETCVATTWVRYCLKLYQITGNPEMMDYIERNLYNFAYGVIDHEAHNNWPIFSYSPLATMARADIYSGTAFFGEDYRYCQSCCVLSGVSLLPTIASAGVLKYADGFAVNLYLPGSVDATTNGKNGIRLTCETNYPTEGDIKYTVGMTRPENLTLKFRIPSWAKAATVLVNGVAIQDVTPGTYAEISRVWSDGDTVELSFDMTAYLIRGSAECSNENGRYNVVVKRGPLVFARDYRLEGDHIFTPLQFEEQDGALVVEKVETPSFDSQLQLKVKLTDGSYVTLVDYGSAGKTMDDRSVMCLWIPTVDYWSVDLTKKIVARSTGTASPITEGTGDGHFVEATAYSQTDDIGLLSNFAWALEKQDNGLYRIKVLATGGYLTVRADYLVISSTEINDEAQLFEIKQCGMNKYKLIAGDGNVLSLYDDGTVYLRDDINHPKQSWKFVVVE